MNSNDFVAKGTLIWLAILCASTGTVLVKDNFITGISLVLISAGLVVFREWLKTLKVTK